MASPEGGRKVKHGSPTAMLYQQPEGHKPVASIPAKFETVLFTGPREKKGFLSEGRRFGDSATDNPGPGTYAYAPTLEYQHDSIGKKGYGTMVSNAKRWKKGVMYTGPGPGVYQPSTPTTSVSFNTKSSAAFHKPIRATPAGEQDDAPGPGAYRAEGATRTGEKLAWGTTSTSTRGTCASSFKATPHGLVLSGCHDSPPPTKYSVVDPWAPGSSLNTASSRTPSRAGMSSFAGKSVSSSVGPVDPSVYLVDPKEASKSKPDTGPGPGSYDMQSFGGISQRVAKASGRASATFRPHEHVDRFGAPLAPSLHSPEDAAAEAMAVKVERSAGAAQRISGPTKGVISPFRSQMPGRAEYNLAELESKPPGPAYYNATKQPARTSFHKNAQKGGLRA